MKVHVNITGGERLSKALEKIIDTKLMVKAGVPEGATTPEGKSIPQYAMYNEIGTSRIPPRPFLRQTINDKQDGWKSFLYSNVDYNNIESDQCYSVMGLLGEIMKADVKETIQKGSFTPDAPSTIANKRRKGKSEPDHPLIDDGYLLESIESEVVR